MANNNTKNYYENKHTYNIITTNQLCKKNSRKKQRLESSVFFEQYVISIIGF